ncbi:MAG: amino acid ABC transporter permease, partial [Sphingomonadales bacterium]|nr:amino acid ABC transporter permease [Sphingomonadales bacterium]
MSDTHAHSVRYVRQAMLPQAEPPATESGAIKWLRENLFSGVLNTTLTIIGLLIVYWLVTAAWPWLSHSVWNANSLAECRQIIRETWGEGATGACWAVIRERWTQFVFGFYPNHLYWRPILAFVLLFGALAPVLFTGLPRGLLWLTALFPFLAVWLLWGGSVWGPVATLLGFGVGWLAFSGLSRFSNTVALLGGIVLALLYWLFLSGSVADLLQGILPLALEGVQSDKFGGFVLSIVIGVSAISLSLPLGIVLALGRQSDMFLVKSLSVCFIEFIRGVPLITLLFTASLLLNYFLPPGSNFDIILRVIIM